MQRDRSRQGEMQKPGSGIKYLPEGRRSQKGDLLLKSGCVINPQHIAVLASGA